MLDSVWLRVSCQLHWKSLCRAGNKTTRPLFSHLWQWETCCPSQVFLVKSKATVFTTVWYAALNDLKLQYRNTWWMLCKPACVVLQWVRQFQSRFFSVSKLFWSGDWFVDSCSVFFFLFFLIHFFSCHGLESFTQIHRSLGHLHKIADTTRCLHVETHYSCFKENWEFLYNHSFT